MNETVTISLGGKAEIGRLFKLAAAVGSPDFYAGKRKWPRITAPLDLELCFDPAGDDPLQRVALQHISEGGIGFWSRTRLRGGKVLYVRESSDNDPRPWLKARVAHCSAALRGFLIGCAFESADQSK